MAAAPPTSRHLEINGLKFHYLDWGGDGPPLVMLHGLTGHANTWDHTAAALSARYHVYALDQRGHGDTDWASRYGIPAMLGDLLGFLDALQLRVVTLMGLSMGGIVSYQFTAAHPERVSRLAVLDIGPEIAPAGGRQVAAALASSDVFASEDEAVAHARAANPRPTDESLRHRVSHNLRPLPDGTLTYKWDKALGDLELADLPRAAGARRRQRHPRPGDRRADGGRQPARQSRRRSGLRAQHHARPARGPARRGRPLARRDRAQLAPEPAEAPAGAPARLVSWPVAARG